MLSIEAKIFEEGEKVRLIFNNEDSQIIGLELSIDQLGEFIRDLQRTANLAFVQRRDAGKGATKASPSRSRPFEAYSAQIRLARSGMFLTLQVSGKDGQTVHLRLPIVLASALSDELRTTLAAAGEKGGDAKH